MRSSVALVILLSTTACASRGGATVDVVEVESKPNASAHVVATTPASKQPILHATRPDGPSSDPDRDGDGIEDAADACPTVAGVLEHEGCPPQRAGVDRDRDRIPDVDDLCPDIAEDMDGFQDEDGCPDPDNDGDGIVDAMDRCPDIPETRNGILDTDGCPD